MYIKHRWALTYLSKYFSKHLFVVHLELLCPKREALLSLKPGKHSLAPIHADSSQTLIEKLFNPPPPRVKERTKMN